MQSGRGGRGRFVNMQSEYLAAVWKTIGTCGTYMGNFPLRRFFTNSYQNITTCVTYMGNFDVTRLRTNSYAQITTCGTYIYCRFLGMAPPVFFDVGGVALNIIGMFFAIAFPILGPGAVSLLLLRVEVPKIIPILRPPKLIHLAFLLATTLWPATSFLPLFDPRVRGEQPATNCTLPPLWH